ncbi:MAG: hypothetical protein NWF00_00930 [Candidatus Bathyarchaeota archaeon]|nr:hypothetical protein [Candidatus Bathyarchaeota archaeon]
MQASFGSVQVFGEKYETDIVVHVDGRVTKRKKKKSKEFKLIYGHTPLSENELDFLGDEKPEVVYVGTGYDAALPITEKAQKALAKFETVVLPTPELIERFELEKRAAVAIIHVTC